MGADYKMAEHESYVLDGFPNKAELLLLAAGWSLDI